MTEIKLTPEAVKLITGILQELINSIRGAAAKLPEPKTPDQVRVYTGAQFAFTGTVDLIQGTIKDLQEANK
jgi:hypothetical protein